MKVVVNGANKVAEVPGLETLAKRAEIVCTATSEALGQALEGAEVLLGWNFQGRELAENWEKASDLKWIHWCGAGVDSALFPELVQSEVLLTNARGIFDQPMAEYVLGYMLSETKLFRETWDLQNKREWDHRLTSRLAGTSAVIVGVGSIGRSISRLLRASDVSVCGVGRHSRKPDPDFGEIYSRADAEMVVREADWVVGVLPLTPETDLYFDEDFFSLMKPRARFMNIGRGASQDEAALTKALRSGKLAGAMLDVFHIEPLPEHHELWSVPNLFVSPHMSGDYHESYADLARQFLDNFELYAEGKPLNNLIDKHLGFASPA